MTLPTPTIQNQSDKMSAFAGAATNVLRAAKGSTEPMLKQHWCVWDGRPSAVGRQHAMPHIKTYLRHR